MKKNRHKDITAIEFHKLIELLNSFEQALKSWNRLQKIVLKYDKDNGVKHKIELKQLSIFDEEE